MKSADVFADAADKLGDDGNVRIADFLILVATEDLFCGWGWLNSIFLRQTILFDGLGAFFYDRQSVSE
ncbi:hypothetical protein OAL43_01810 [bacterium]|nr:hypothetical protein [bacterium]